MDFSLIVTPEDLVHIMNVLLEHGQMTAELKQEVLDTIVKR